jgi:hemolysin activation/secretion protein
MLPRPSLATRLAALHRSAVWCSGLLWLAAAGGSGLAAPATNAPAPATTNSLAPSAAKVLVSPPPLVPAYEVHRFEVLGGGALAPEVIAHATQGAVGPAVSLPQIRRALVRLQEACRELGFTNASVSLPRQPLTNGVVLVRLAGLAGAEVSPRLPEEPPTASPTYAVRHFEVRGNTLLEAGEIDRIIGPLAGQPVTEGQIHQALARLQAAYRARGRARVMVVLPQQVLTDGTVAIHVHEGKSPGAEAAELLALRQPATPATPPVRTFLVRRYEVTGNTLLRPEVVDALFTNAVGPAVSLPQIQKALGELQLAYRERGFATVTVGLPQQQLADGVVKVSVTEGALVDIQVVGNRWFSSNNVARALPSLSTNGVFNSRIFQRELDLANQNRDRQILPVIGPGPDPGTSQLTLRVKDRFPLHGRVEVNNHAPPGTPDWRINSSAQYNNLWQEEHQLGLSYSFTPEQFKPEGLVPDRLLNRPLVANYGAYYRLPFGQTESVAEQLNRSSAFGFDEATRQFRLPPPGARPDVTFFASAASSDTGLQLGPANPVSQTPLLSIVSQDAGRNLSINESVGARLNLPWVLDDRRRAGFSFGADLKRFALDSFNTNTFIITTVVTNAQGSQTIQSRVASPQPMRSSELIYLPLVASADYSQTDVRGAFSANLSLSVNVLGRAADVVAVAGTPAAEANFAKVALNLTRDQKLPGDWLLVLRAGGQWASSPLLGQEQFALGGINSVRGYFEGQEFGDGGWFGSAELRTPFLATQVPAWTTADAPVWLRGVAFLDNGQRVLLDPAAGVPATRYLLGAGLGVSANVNNQVDMRLTVAWPFVDAPNRSAFTPRAYFSLGGQF